jgi:hypothetical protein
LETYTRRVDRFFSPVSGPFSNTYQAEKLAGYFLEKAAFFGADNLWNSFQQGIFNFATEDPNNGGSSIINQPIKNRPPFKNALKDLLKQSGTIKFVPCGN